MTEPNRLRRLLKKVCSVLRPVPMVSVMVWPVSTLMRLLPVLVSMLSMKVLTKVSRLVSVSVPPNRLIPAVVMASRPRNLLMLPKKFSSDARLVAPEPPILTAS